MGKMQRDKGKRWERAVASALRSIFGEQVCRGWQTRMGSDDPDVKNIPRQWVEAKHDNGISVYAAIEQAVAARDAAKQLHLLPVVYYKKDRRDPLVVLRMDDWLLFVREWWSWHQEIQKATGRILELEMKARDLEAARGTDAPTKLVDAGT